LSKIKKCFDNAEHIVQMLQLQFGPLISFAPC